MADGLCSRAGAHFRPVNVPPGTKKTPENFKAKECPHFGQILLLAELLGIPDDKLRNDPAFCGVMSSWGEDGMMFSGDKTEAICACLPLLCELHNQYHFAMCALRNPSIVVELKTGATASQIALAKQQLELIEKLTAGQEHLGRMISVPKPKRTPEGTLDYVKSTLDATGQTIMGIEKLSAMSPSAVVNAVEGLLHCWGNLRDKACENMPIAR